MRHCPACWLGRWFASLAERPAAQTGGQSLFTFFALVVVPVLGVCRLIGYCNGGHG